MPTLLRLPLLVLVLVLSHDSAMAAETTTDPAEVEALKIFASKLGISWNFSVDPCSGLDNWNDSSRDKSSNLEKSSGIQCDCSSSSVCHVTAITVISMNAPGEIAPEVGNFSYLYDLNLGQNVLTGSIPEEIGSLSQLQYFNVAINKLSGSLPRSIGKLKQVISMGFGSNNLAGSLPKEVGNMTSLLKLYMDACGLGGELPAELGNLKRLETLWMAYNDFNGTIPEFLGSLSNLVELKMFGNNFQGPIPESLGNLSALTRLEIGDVSSGGVIPTSFNNLTGLKTLSLRNCELSGSIPELGNLTSLQELDLSFNNLTGQIPASFGSFASLNNLFLGSNKLSGQVPTQIGSLQSLQRLDVSFNNLSGPLPTWWNDSSLNVNLIQNRFDVTEKGVALRCLLGRSNCSAVVDGKNFGFSINSGGVKVSSSTGTSFSNDSQPLTVSYYMNSAEGWAVSSIGHLDGGDRSVSSTTRTITGTIDPASIYQTARTAPSSLKYLGFGMKNGPYKVELHFAEINIDNNSDYSNIARRMFDVYIQGARVLTGLNIQNEAKGSYKAIRKIYNLSVSDNVVEVHFFWRGKGTWGHGPMVSAIQVLPEYDTTGLATETKSNDSKSVQIGVGVAASLVFIIMLIGIFLYRRRRQNLKCLDEDIKNFEGKPNLFTYNEMKMATRGFASETKLGQGGFGAVYKGVLSDGTMVAIKQLSSISQQGTREFLNEVNLISAVQHRNLVKLHGCCLEGGHRILVYEFLENNSLHHTLLKSRMHFDWQTRFNIIVGVARGIAYLHEESMPRIVHRDIKASNVLLDKSLNPKIADFGLAKFFQDHETHISTRVAGTTGYLAPEYAMWGQLTEKADVYSYGVLILEIVSGRDNLETNQPGKMVHLLGWAWQLYENGEALELLDKKVDEFSEEEVLRVIQVALLCAQTSASLRPKMSYVVSMLTGTAPVDVSSLRPGYSSAMEHGFLPNILASDALQDPSQISSKQFCSETNTSGTSAAWSKDSSQA